MPRSLRPLLLPLLAAPLIAIPATPGMALLGGVGNEWIIGQVERAVSTPDFAVKFDGVEGSVPTDFTVREIRLSDGRGVFARLNGAHLSLTPSSLARGRLRIEALTAQRVAVERAPVAAAAGTKPQSDTGAGIALPDLPVGVELDRLAIDELRLAEPLLGEAAVLRLAGSASLAAGGGTADLRLEIARIDSKPGQLAVNATFEPEQNRLDIGLRVSEPAGGVLARAAALPGLPPVEIDLAGSGPLDAWRGRLNAAAGDAIRLAADATIQAAGGTYTAALTASGRLDGMLPPDSAPLVGPAASLRAEVSVAPDRAVTVRTAEAEAAAGRLRLSGTVGPGGETIDLHTTLEAGADSSLRRLLPGFGWETARLAGAVSGGATAPKLTLDGTVEGMRADDPALAPLLAPRLALELRAAADTARGRIVVDGLRLSAPAAELAASGAAEGWGRTADATLRLTVADLDRFAGLAGVPLAGRLEIAGPLAVAEGGAVRAMLDGQATGLASGTPADALLGAAPTLRLEAARQADGVVRLSLFRLVGAYASAVGKADLTGGRLAGEMTVALPALAPVGTALGTELAGSASLQATADGPLDALALRVAAKARGFSAAGRRFGDSEVIATVGGLPAAPVGRLDLKSALAGGVTAGAAYALAGQSVRLSGLSLAAGPNRITGDAELLLDRSLVRGRLEGQLPQLAAFSELAGLPLTGDGRFAVTLTPQDGRQSATLSLDARGFRAGGPQPPVFAAKRLSLTADGNDLTGLPGGKARLTIEDAMAAGSPLARATASLDGKGGSASFSAGVSGGGPAAATLDLGGRVEMAGGAVRVRVERLRGSAKGQAFRLTQPAVASVGNGGGSLAGLRLTLGEARLAVDGSLTGDRLDGKLRLDRLPLSLAALANPGLALGGTLAAEATVGGTLADPRADASLHIAGFRAAATTSSGVPPLDLHTSLRWRERRIRAEGTVTGPAGDMRLTLAGSAPLALDPATGAPSVPPQGGVEGTVSGTVNLALLNDLLAGSGDRARGALQVDLKAAGTVSAPRLGGTLALADGRYENRASGAVLTDIAARVTGDGDRLTVETLSARTAGGGTLRGGGTVRLAGRDGAGFDLKLTADRALLLNTELVQASVGADLTLAGPLTQARLAGPVRIQRAEIQVPDRLPPGVVKLDVREVGRPRNRPPTAAPAKPAAEAGGMQIGLDLTVKAQNRVFVRGRGLDAELAADLAVAGTAAVPRVTGQLRLVKGQLDAIGQRFTFSRLLVDFDGETPIDPRLDVVAEAEANDVTAQVLVTGTASRPKLELASAQGLPQDEVLARVLFGQSANQISAGQAIQLAQSAAELAGLGGSGGGLLEQVRRKLGVDRLEFTQGQNGSPGGLEAGRYVSDRVYVGVSQGVGANQSRAKVEVDLTGAIKAEADVGTDADTRVGVKMEWNY